MNNENLSFSIVICTYNRDEFLERTLRSLSHLLYTNFEVVVVNGPSTDRTSEILEQYKGRIKIENNPEANLSISRNIGIAAASGDVIAFLDDDAIPEPNWLHQIKEVYESKDPIGGAGGRVYGPGGDHFQFHNGYINVWGDAEVKLDNPGPYTSPNNDKFNIMMGVNSTFSRKALLEVGGFDEYYEYFHDESDLCVRLTRSSFPIYHHQEAYVHHEFARSHIRKSIYKLNWYPIVKNTVYFGIKNSSGIKNIFKRIVRPYLTARKRVDDFKMWLRDGNISKEDYISFMSMWRRGVWRGYIDGFFKSRQLRFDMQLREPFLTYEKEVITNLDPAIIHFDEHKPNQIKKTKGEKFGICLLSRYYPPFGSGGVATYTKALAEGLASKGYPVYVLTSHVPEKEQLINGVIVKEVSESGELTDFDYLGTDFPVTKRNVTYSILVSEEVERLRDQGLIEIVETPLWDYEGLAVTSISGIKTFVRLETPLKKAAQTQNWKWNPDFELSSQLERRLIENADGVITISQNVKNTIGELYEINWTSIETNLVPLGLLKSEQISEEINVNENNPVIKVLFVGRLEPRKGIDILLKAFKQVIKKHNNVKLIIAGNNKIPFNNGLTIQQIFEKESALDVRKHVEFLGEVSDEKLQELYRDCDFFVAPSRYESFGLVYLEAMRYGKAVIGTRTGGVPEVINEGVTGLLVSPENIEQLKEAIERLIEDRDLSVELGKNGTKRLKEDFTVESMTEKTLEVYKRLLNS